MILYATTRGQCCTREAEKISRWLVDTNITLRDKMSKVFDAFEPHAMSANATFGEMVANILERFSDTALTCSHIMVLDPSRMPLGRSFLDTLLGDMEASSAVAASCTTLREPPVGIHEPRHVFDRGFNVSLGQSGGKTSPVMARNYFGFSHRDGRAREWEPIHLLSPYCMLVHWSTIKDRAKPLTSATAPEENMAALSLTIPHRVASAITLIDTLLIGASTAVETIRAVETLHLRQKFLSAELSKISVLTLKKLPDTGRTIVRQAFNTVLESQKLLKDLHGDSWASRNFSIINGAPAAENDKAMKACRQNGTASVTINIECVTHLVLDQFNIAHRWLSYKAVTPPEEHVGWSLSMLVHEMYSNGGAPPLFIASKATAILNPHNLPRAVRPYGVATVIPATAKVLDIASYALIAKDIFWSVHRGALEVAFPITFRSAKETATRLRVVWDAFCCHCCGFSNEMVHLLHPLQKRLDVRTPLVLDCFCPGFPLAVEDSLERLYMPKDAFPVERLSPDEVTVWISHTEPTRYANEVFKYRHPDYVVGRSMYEFTKIEDGWRQPIQDDCDEVWVPATFVANAFINSNVDPRKVVVIPEAIDTFFYDSAAHDRIPLPLTPANPWRHFCNRPRDDRISLHYKFFSNFKWEPRKGWDILFNAYFTGFKHDDPVSLYVLTHIWTNGAKETYTTKHNQTRLREHLGKLAVSLGYSFDLSDLPHVCIIADDLEEAEVAQLYRSSNAFVLPTRGEGWGLPTMQAMSMGMPVISTAWGGQTDFMTPNNSFMIPVEAVEDIPKNSEYRWASGKQWALPSLNATRRLMQLVFTDRALAEERGAAARSHIVTHFSEEAVADIVEARLLRIQQIVMERRSRGEFPPTHVPPTDMVFKIPARPGGLSFR